MVDKTQIPLANQLIAELASIAGAISNIDAGGKITSMVIGAPPVTDGEPTVPHQVVTTYMDAPPTMYAAIKGFLTQRQTDINTQLTGMGVTVGA